MYDIIITRESWKDKKPKLEIGDRIQIKEGASPSETRGKFGEVVTLKDSGADVRLDGESNVRWMLWRELRKAGDGNELKIEDYLKPFIVRKFRR